MIGDLWASRVAPLVRASVMPGGIDKLKKFKVKIDKFIKNGPEVRGVFFQSGTTKLQPPPGKRSVGRPRQMWQSIVQRHCLEAAGNDKQLAASFHPGPGAALRWRLAVESYISK